MAWRGRESLGRNAEKDMSDSRNREVSQCCVSIMQLRTVVGVPYQWEKKLVSGKGRRDTQDAACKTRWNTAKLEHNGKLPSSRLIS